MKYAGTSMFAKKAPQVDRQPSRTDQLEERKRRLKEVAEKARKPEKEKSKLLVPTGKMKSSQPRSAKLLEELRTAGPSKPPVRKAAAAANIVSRPVTPTSRQQEVRERHLSEGRASDSGESWTSAASAPAGKENGAPPHMRPMRRPSLGFLDEEVKLDKEIIKKKEKFKATADGYQVPKKLSVSNVDYNVCSQDISKMAVKAKPLYIPGISAEKQQLSRPAAKSTRICWRDECRAGPLVDIRYIERANNRRKILGKDWLESSSAAAAVPSPKATRDVTLDDFLQAVLTWTPSWLKEQKRFTAPPKVQGDKWQLLPLPDTFSSWEEYRKIFIPLMLHELWAVVSREAEEKEEALREDIVPVCIQETVAGDKERFRTFHACALITESDSRRDLAADGTLVILNLSFFVGEPSNEANKQPKEIRPCFGFARRVVREPLNAANGFGEQDKKCIATLEKELARNDHRMKDLKYLVRYTIQTRLSQKVAGRRLCLDKPVILKVLTRIKPEIRKVQALLELQKSALWRSITNPDLRSLGVSLGNENLHPVIKNIPQVEMLNSMQKKIIVGVGRACLDDPKAAKIALVQGPPGTGKSATIVGMILHIWAARSSTAIASNKAAVPRILVVAPSNAAVDELALKLIAVRAELPETSRFNMIRLGVTKSVHPAVVPYTYDMVLQRNIEAETRKIKASESLEADERNKQLRANQLYADKEAAEQRGNKDLAAKLERDFKDTMRERDKIRESLNRPLERRQRQELAASAELRVMAGVDVILSTLSSCSNQAMENYFLHSETLPRAVQEHFRGISICIMDEASQCVEPEALIPLKFGFTKLVMVGDPAQLPATVLSRTAKEHDYHQSLFKRLFKTFALGIGPDGRAVRTDIPGLVRGSVMRLDTQYRMHQDIGDWPSRYFYGGLLAPGEQQRKSPLAPYTILNLKSTESSAKGGIWNKEEEKWAVDTVEAVRTLAGKKDITVGIITFYAKQKQNISLEVQNRRLQGVDVNTVDGYQGSERDVIIISCVRAGGNSIGFLEDTARLNVGLTRAKLALIIIGNLDTLGKHSTMWKELIHNGTARGAVFQAGPNTRLMEVLACSRQPGRVAAY